MKASRILEQTLKFFEVDDFRTKPKEVLAPMPGLDEYNRQRPKLHEKYEDLPIEIRQLCSEPLLNQEQEYHLFRLYNYHKWKFMQLREKGHFSKCKKHLHQSYAVRSQIVACNLRLVAAIVKKHVLFKSLPTLSRLDELVSDGNLGLIAAVDYFDFRKPFKFSTYATYAIRDSVTRQAGKRADKLGKYETRFLMDDEDVIDLVPDSSQPELPVEIAEFVVASMMEVLPPRIRTSVELYYGVNKSERKDLNTIGRLLGLSKERARQLREQGLQIIRRHLEEDGNAFSFERLDYHSAETPL